MGAEMRHTPDTTRLAWLMNRLGEKRRHLGGLLDRLRGFAFSASGAPASDQHRKFAHLMDQIDEERTKEIRLINRIEDIEALHRLRRSEGGLEDTARATNDNMPEAAAPEPERKEGWFWLVVAWLALSNGKKMDAKSG